MNRDAVTDHELQIEAAADHPGGGAFLTAKYAKYANNCVSNPLSCISHFAVNVSFP